jgi:hypothetical protein
VHTNSCIIRGPQRFKHIHKGRTAVVPDVIDKNIVLLKDMWRDLPHVTICLFGNIKGETKKDHHLIRVANKTLSGLCTQWWLEKLIEVCHSECRLNGPAFELADGLLASSTDYNAMFRKYLNVMQDKTVLIPNDHDFDAFYSTFCTPRKTATTRIEQAGFGHQFVDQMKRRRPQEKAQGWGDRH